MRRDYVKARQVFTAACKDYNHAASCYAAATLAYLGEGGPADKDASQQMTLKSCEEKYPQGCHQMGVLMASGEWAGKRNFVKAEKYFQQGCDLGHDESCFSLVNFYIRGKEGVAKDMKKAFDVSLKLCDDRGHYPSCVNVSQMYLKGDGVTQDFELAKKYRARAVEIHKQEKDTQESIKFS